LVALGRPPHRARGGHDLLIPRSGTIVQVDPLLQLVRLGIRHQAPGDRESPTTGRPLRQAHVVPPYPSNAQLDWGRLESAGEVDRAAPDIGQDWPYLLIRS
jgi:hypothetical protein